MKNEKILLRVSDVPEIIGCGLTKVNELIKKGLIKTFVSPDPKDGIVWVRPEDLEEFKNSLVPAERYI